MSFRTRVLCVAYSVIGALLPSLTHADYVTGSMTVSGYSKISAASQLPAGTLNTYDRFGCAAVELGDNDFDGVNDLMIGASGRDSVGDPNFDHGGVFTTWMNSSGAVTGVQAINQDEGLLPYNLTYGDEFGKSIAALGLFEDYWGPDVAVGAPGDNGGFVSNSGAVYIMPVDSFQAFAHYTTNKICNGSTGFTATLDANDQFGYSVTCLGDWDGDGVKDIAVGAPGDDDGGTDCGAVYILYLNADGSVKSHVKLSWNNPFFANNLSATAEYGTLSAGDKFGSSIACLGDLNGDGYPDLAIGASGDTDHLLNTPRGAVWVFFMQPNGTPIAYEKINWENDSVGYLFPSYGEFGEAVGAPGDLDGDGVPDMLVGAPGETNGRGSAYVCLMWPNGRVKQAQRLAPGEGGMPAAVPALYSRFGSAVNVAQDYSGNGIKDLLIGAENDSDSGTEKGAVYVCNLSLTTSTVVVPPSGFGATKLLNTDAEIDGKDEDVWGFGPPKLATNGNGVWIAVWDKQDWDTLDSDIVYSRSLDNGETWSAPGNVMSDWATDTRNDTGQNILYVGNNTWLCYWNGGYYSRSTNNGLTWSTIAQTQTSKTNLGYDTMATDGNGKIVHEFNAKIKNNSTDSDMYTVNSTDYGATWSSPVLVMDTTYNDNDPRMSTDGNGTWVLTWEDNEGGAVASRSTNLGATWSARSTIGININDYSPEIDNDRHGTWIITWKTREGFNDRLLARRSTNGGVTWSSPITVFTGEGDFCIPKSDTKGLWLASFSVTGLVDREYYYVASRDGGLTWGTPRTINDHWVMDSYADDQGELFTDKNGRWIAAWKSQEQFLQHKFTGVDADVCYAISDSMDTFYSNATGGGNYSTGSSWTGGIAPVATTATLVVMPGDTIALASQTTATGLTVMASGVFQESAAGKLGVTGTTTNSGTLRTIRNVSGAGSQDFNLTKAKMNVNTAGSLSSIQVDRHDSNSPYANQATLQTGKYWDITPTGSGYNVNLTLPYNSAQVSDPYLARWNGSNWSAARSSFTATEATLNGVTAFSQWTISGPLDTTPPTISLSTIVADPTNTSPIPVAVTLSESSANFAVADITPTNATVSNFTGSGTSYTFDLVAASQGTVSAVVNAGTFTDAAGNPNTVSNTLSRTYDSVVPTISLSSAAPDPTNSSPVAVSVTLSESSTNFVSTDISPTNASVSGFTGSGSTYSFDLVPSGQGSVAAVVNAGAFSDSAGNANTASNTLSRTYDSVAPTVALSSVASEPTNTSPIAVSVSLSENSNNFGSGDVTPTNAAVTNFSGSGTSYSFDLVPTGQGSVSAAVGAGTFTDAAGNANSASNTLSRTLDSISPSIVLSSSATDPTTTSPIPVSVTLSESATDFTSADISATSASIANFSGSGSIYSFDLVPTGQGYVSAVVNAGAFSDSAANPNPMSNVLSRMYDSIAPSVTSVSVQTSYTVDVTFSEPMSAGITTAANYSLSGTGRGSFATNPTTVTLVSDSTYLLQWGSGQMVNGGSITITVANVFDIAGNIIGSPNSGTHAGGGVGAVTKDFDGDGYEDNVELRFGSDPSSAGSTPPSGFPYNSTADSDGDGYKDFYEYGLGYDPSDANSHPLLGDLNNDGFVNGADAIILKRIAVGTFNMYNYNVNNMDMNRDGIVNGADAIILQRYVVHTVTMLPTQ